MEIINQTVNGKIFKCSSCKAIHIEYKNLNFNFSQADFEHFKKVVSKIDGTKYEKLNKDVPYRRKIILPTGHRSVNFLLFNDELIELQQLIGDGALQIPKFQKIQIKDMVFFSYNN